MSDDEALEYCKNNPEFFEKLEKQLFNIKKNDKVVDLKAIAMLRFRQKFEELTIQNKNITDISKNNFETFANIKLCILAMLTSDGLPKLFEVIYSKWTKLLNVDLIKVGIETDIKGSLPIESIAFLPKGFVNNMFGNENILIQNGQEARSVFAFGDGLIKPLIKSSILIKLPFSNLKSSENKDLMAVIGFGFYKENHCNDEHGYEHIIFLCECLAIELAKQIKAI